MPRAASALSSPTKTAGFVHLTPMAAGAHGTKQPPPPDVMQQRGTPPWS